MRKLLREMAAEKAADAGRLLCEADPKDRESTSRQDAQSAADEANHLSYAAELLAQMSLKSYKWRHVELQPVAETITEPA